MDRKKRGSGEGVKEREGERERERVGEGEGEGLTWKIGCHYMKRCQTCKDDNG